ncbi:MAG: class I SAM-dependent methyltransferase [Alphaproteobacteria bacterium]
MSDPVRAQYEAYPYPARDPRDEARRLITGSPSHLLEIDHYLFAARRDPARPFRALIAGGGTGDAAIMLAQQLADHGTDAEVVHLDLSAASRRIAEERARLRGLANLRFVTGSLLDAATLGRFDYIDCCGVLHHLDDSAAGLRALATALSPDGGGIGLMVYGELGRAGVYPTQDLLRMIAPADAPAADRVAVARRLVKALPETNQFRRNPFLADHLSTDAGLFDLLLHARDRAYRLPELLVLLADAGLRPVTFIEPIRYVPEIYVADPALKRRFADLPVAARWAAAELLSGAMKVHIVYAVPGDRTDTVAVPADDAVPALRDMAPDALGRALRPGQPLVAGFDGFQLSFPMPRLAGPIAARIDGARTVAAIRDDLRASVDRGLTDAAFAEAWTETWRVLNGINRLLIARYA